VKGCVAKRASCLSSTPNTSLLAGLAEWANAADSKSAEESWAGILGANPLEGSNPSPRTMPIYRYIVSVETDTQKHADQVMVERIDHDEQYADENNIHFDYQIDWEYD
jgi:hypothetical protein